jgi:hypothetical protein
VSGDKEIIPNSLSQSIPIYYYAFDLLNQNGELIVNLPFSRRRELLENLGSWNACSCSRVQTTWLGAPEGLFCNRLRSDLRYIRESLSALGLSTKAFVAVSWYVGPKSARSSLEPAFGFPQH